MEELPPEGGGVLILLLKKALDFSEQEGEGEKVASTEPSLSQ